MANIKLTKVYKTVIGTLKMKLIKMRKHNKTQSKKNPFLSHEKDHCNRVIKGPKDKSVNVFQKRIEELKPEDLNVSLGPDFKIYESDYLFIKSTPKKAPNQRSSEVNYMNIYQTPPPPLPPKNEFFTPPPLAMKNILC